MTRGILIAGNESALFTAVAAEAAKRVDRFAAAPIPNRLTGAVREIFVPEPEESGELPGDRGIRIPWNPGNPIAARSLIVAVENRLERIDEAILICAPPAVNGPPAALSPVDIEIMVNDHIKGWFFLIKELCSLFRSRKTGILALAAPEIVPGNREALPNLLGIPAIAAFRALVQGLLTSSPDESYQTLGFTAADSEEETAFASFIFKAMEEPSRRNTGKWYKFGKRNLFNR